MILKLKKVDGSIYDLEVDETQPIDTYRDKIQEKTNVEPSHQRLIYRGSVLDGTKSLQDVHFETGHVIHLVPGVVNRNTAPNEEEQTEDVQPAADMNVLNNIVQQTIDIAQNELMGNQQQPQTARVVISQIGGSLSGPSEMSVLRNTMQGIMGMIQGAVNGNNDPGMGNSNGNGSQWIPGQNGPLPDGAGSSNAHHQSCKH